MKKNMLLLGILTITTIANAQEKYFTKTGKISFDATAPKSPENIDAINKNATCVLDTKTGEVQFSVLMKGFEFERALMLEHFNENYVESNKFPKTIFKGNILNNEPISYTKNGVYSVKVKGKLTMHGETKDVETSGKITAKDGKLFLSSAFAIAFEDYKISIPQLVSDKVSKTAKITVDCSLEILKK
jgi:hypothetical protein